MYPWLHEILREEAGGGEGGGGTTTVTETPEAKELRETKEENTRLRSQNDELSQSEREWSRIARAKPEPAAPVVKEKLTEEEIETGEQLLDDLSKEGLAALKKRGFVHRDELKQYVDESIERAQGDGRTENNYQAIMSSEFPEILEDLDRIAKGLKPQSEIFMRTAGIYQDAYTLDPELKGSKSALIMASRQAAAQLSMEGKREIQSEADRQADRRKRIDNQRPDRSRKGSDATEETGLTAKQKEAAALLGVSEADFTKSQEKIRGARGK